MVFLNRATSAEGGTTSNDDMDRLGSVVVGRMAGLEERGRGAPEVDDSEDEMSWGGPSDSRISSIELGVNTGRVPKTAAFSLGYDVDMSTVDTSAPSESEESPGSRPMSSGGPKSKAPVSKLQPQRAISQSRLCGWARTRESNSNHAEKPTGGSVESRREEET